MTEEEIRAEVERLAPFHHKVDLPHGLSTCLAGAPRRRAAGTRVQSLVRHAFPPLLQACGGSLAGKRVLDVACNCGGFSLEAARLGAEHVLGFDSVERYIEQAEFLKRALNVEQVEFRRLDAEQLDAADVGTFDVTFCFGILYHLENPVLAMKRIAAVTRQVLLVDTHVMSVPFTRKPLWLMNMPPPADPDSMKASASLWRGETGAVQFRPNEAAVVALLQFLGFPRVAKIKPASKGVEDRYREGKRAAFLAER